MRALYKYYLILSEKTFWTKVVASFQKNIAMWDQLLSIDTFSFLNIWIMSENLQQRNIRSFVASNRLVEFVGTIARKRIMNQLNVCQTSRCSRRSHLNAGDHSSINCCWRTLKAREMMEGMEDVSIAPLFYHINSNRSCRVPPSVALSQFHCQASSLLTVC